MSKMSPVQVIDLRVHGKGRKMCTARPQWMSISQQKINYKDKSYRVEVNIVTNNSFPA